MSDRAHAWLALHSGSVPPELEAVMTHAVDQVVDTGSPIHDMLAESACVCLRRAMQNCEDRTAALPLLGADALITCACEAAAQIGLAPLETLADAWSADRLEHLLAQS